MEPDISKAVDFDLENRSCGGAQGEDSSIPEGAQVYVEVQFSLSRRQTPVAQIRCELTLCELFDNGDNVSRRCGQCESALPESEP